MTDRLGETLNSFLNLDFMKIFLILLFAAISQGSIAQNPITTFILFRHAEKVTDGTKDPDLTEAGKKRAESLVKLLASTKIDAVYSTNFKRTQNTVAPLAQAHSLSILNYDGSKMDEIDNMLTKFNGGTIVLSGHSNTTPAIVNYLTGHKDEFNAFDDADYGNLIIVSVLRKGEAKVSWLRY
jgi:2,3-bisphosphoglycerate-dependent phosphoglycerate mutase